MHGIKRLAGELPLSDLLGRNGARILAPSLLACLLGVAACISGKLPAGDDDSSMGGGDAGARDVGQGAPGVTDAGGTSEGEDAGGTPGPSDAGSNPGDIIGTQGCNGNTEPPTSSSNGYLTINVNGTPRKYTLELPRSYDGRTPVPVMFAFHGTDGSAQEFLGNDYGGVRAGAARRVLLVGPQGLSRDGMTGWLDDSSDTGIDPADIEFFDALLAQIKANYCIDPGRVFSMGHSAGAFISNQLGCVRSDVLRGIGPFAGGGPEVGQGTGTSCEGRVAAFIVHNPRDGDPEECADLPDEGCFEVARWADTGWPTTKFWTMRNGCDALGSMPTEAFPGNSTTGDPLPCRSYSGCDAAYPVTLCLEAYSDDWEGPHAFPVEWGAKAVTDFFLALPRVR